MLLKRNGRHEETRTPDLYRVKRLRCSIYNNLHESEGLLSLCKSLINRKSGIYCGLVSRVEAFGRLDTTRIWQSSPR
jgi:hypothetical protein